MYFSGIFTALGFLLASFVIWRKAKDEAFEEEKVFDALILTVVCGLIGGRLEFALRHWSEFGFDLVKFLWLTRYAGLGFNTALLAGSLGLWWLVKSGRIRPAGGAGQTSFWSVADLAVFGLVLGQAVAKTGAFIDSQNWLKLAEVIWLLLLLFSLKHWERRYRLFEWYRGKKKQAPPGFLFLAYLFFYFLGQLLLAIFQRDSLYLDILMILASLTVLYLCSGREWRQDLAQIRFKK